MPIRNIIIIVLITIFSHSAIKAQHYIGLTGGYSMGTFTNFVKKQEYDANYRLKNGVSLSSFYETKIDSICNLKIELQYRWQNADMDIDYHFGHSSFYKNIDYSFHLLNLNLICSFQLVKKKSFNLFFLLGPTFAYNVNIAAKGNGWEYYSQTQIDTNGNSKYILTTRQWEKNERNSKDLSTFNVGIDLGLEFIIPINNRLDFLIHNRYNIYFTSFTKQIYTSLFLGNLNIGVRYNFSQ